MSFRREDFPGMRVTVMGLGLHGGGTASARFFAAHGADVTVTDLRGEETLADSIRRLSDYSVRFVLGKHEYDDFRRADLVIKNPGVPGNSPFLREASRIETDISVFLDLVDPPLLAVTGSKGKSTTVSALFHIMKESCPGVRLGGNITVSPLTFLDELLDCPGPVPPVILELSSWQLADLRGKKAFRPDVSCITNILFDHQNRYDRFEDYVDDKRVIFTSQDKKGVAIFLYDRYGKEFARERGEGALFFSPGPLPEDTPGGWLDRDGEGYIRFRGETAKVLSSKIKVPGEHNRLNLLCAGMMAYIYGVEPDRIRGNAEAFPGIPHRLEFVMKKRGLRFYNDSAATIPDAVAFGVRSFSETCVLITGGTDKDLDFSPYESVLHLPRAVVLLAGSGTEKIIPILQERNIRYSGPYSDMKEACREAVKQAIPGDVVLLSPGCASFEFFDNEFHRGNIFKAAIKNCV